jgi:hypothetical protein
MRSAADDPRRRRPHFNVQLDSVHNVNSIGRCAASWSEPIRNGVVRRGQSPLVRVPVLIEPVVGELERRLQLEALRETIVLPPSGGERRVRDGAESGRVLAART